MYAVDCGEMWKLPLYAAEYIRIGKLTYRYYPMRLDNGGLGAAVFWDDKLLCFDTLKEMVSTIENLTATVGKAGAK